MIISTVSWLIRSLNLEIEGMGLWSTFVLIASIRPQKRGSRWETGLEARCNVEAEKASAIRCPDIQFHSLFWEFILRLHSVLPLGYFDISSSTLRKCQCEYSREYSVEHYFSILIKGLFVVYLRL